MMGQTGARQSAGRTGMSPASTRRQLDSVLAGLVGGARLRQTRLDMAGLEHALTLWLIDPEGMDAPLSELETDAVFESPPYWSFCWGSGLALARHILANPTIVRDKTVVDFGAGSGVVGIAAALSGAESVIACDIDADARKAVALNAALNGVSVVCVETLDALVQRVDILFAADVLYDATNLGLLLPFRAVANRVVIADSRMPNFQEPEFARFAEIEAVTVPDLGEPENVGIVRFYTADGVD